MAKLIISQKTGEAAAEILGVWSDFGGGRVWCLWASFREGFLFLWKFFFQGGVLVASWKMRAKRKEGVRKTKAFTLGITF